MPTARTRWSRPSARRARRGVDASEQSIVVIVSAAATVATLLVRSWLDRKATEDALKVAMAKTEAEAKVIADALAAAVVKAEAEAKALAVKVETTAKVVATKVETAGDKAASAVAEVKEALDGIDQIRVMVDGQRTAMTAELKTATAKIADLEKVILAQRETAAAKAGPGP